MEKLKADMVVIGGGGSGLVAAVSAAEAGVRNIVVLEKNKRAGGYAISAGGMMAFDSPAQRRLGIRIDKDEIFKDKMTRLNWQVNARLVRNIIETSVRLLAGLKAKACGLMKFFNLPQMKKHHGYFINWTGPRRGA